MVRHFSQPTQAARTGILGQSGARRRFRLKRFSAFIAGAFLAGGLANAAGHGPYFFTPGEANVMPAAHQQADQILGIGTHVGGRSTEGDFSVALTIRSVNELGITSVRDELAWSSFVSPDPAQDRQHNAPLLALLRAVPGRPVLTFGLGNVQLNQGRLPRGPNQLAEYQSLVRRAYAIVAPFHPILEVWNEWNLGTGTATRDKGSAEDYVAAAKAASEAVSNQLNPPTLLVGSAGDDAVDWRWTMDIIRLGALRYGNGLSVHIYNQCRPVNERSAENVLLRLQDLHAKMAAAGVPANYPVYITEAGWPTHNGSCGLTQYAAAQNVARLLAELQQVPWVKGVWLYDLRDDGNDAENQEDRFGLFDHAYNPKPAACAVAQFTQAKLPDCPPAS